MRKFCKVEKDGRILLITLNRPAVHNSLHAPACFELEQVFDEFESDPDLWVAIITGAGDKAFCAGHDLADAPDAPMPRSGWAGLAERTTLTKPLIAAVNGYAFGGGFEIALCCDIVVAADSATFALSEPRVGAVALGGGVQRVALQLPRAIAMSLLLTGRRFDAQQAHRWGLVTEVTPPDQVLGAARRWAEEILACAPLCVRHTKRLALEAQEGSQLPHSIAAHVREIVPQLFASADTQEGIRAFLEKRKPVWHGR